MQVSGRMMSASDSRSDRAGEEGSAIGSGRSPGAPTYPDDASTIRVTGSPNRIRFSCPGGHVLHGPDTLHGRLLKCPVCGVQFHVQERPILGGDVQRDPESIHDSVTAGELADAIDPIDAGASDDFLAGADDLALDLPSAEELAASKASAKDAGKDVSELDIVEEDASGRANAKLFEQLWSHRPPGGCVEIHLLEGAVLSVEHFSAAQSTARHAVVAMRNKQGNYRVEAILWSSILRLALPDIDDLPEDF